MWRRASEELESLTVETRAGDLRRHPLIKVIADAASDMVRFSGEFGLTPVARTRIAKGIQQAEPSKFSGLLARPQE
jgi:P27 family predicted phage terminase small subunit